VVLKVSSLEPIRSTTSMAQNVKEIVRTAIVKGVLSPGELYSMQSLAQQLQVSRTPVRDALLALAEEGLVTFENNRGVRIATRTVEEIREIFELRGWIEGSAASKICEIASDEDIRLIQCCVTKMEEAVAKNETGKMWTADREFHFALHSIAKNQKASGIVDELRNLIVGSGVTVVHPGNDPENVVKMHRQIVECMVQRDAVAAARLTKEYLTITAELIIEKMSADGS